MSEQRRASDEPNASIDLEEWVPEEESLDTLADSTIYQRDGINPAKRRRLEAMREERELMRNLQDVFDDYDFDD